MRICKKVFVFILLIVFCVISGKAPASRHPVKPRQLSALSDATDAVAAVYYVSSEGSDKNDGKSPEISWCTIARANTEPLVPGDVVLFRRGDSWREYIKPRSGDETGYITYGAYGSGDKPLLLGSVEKNDPKDWKHEGGNIWNTTGNVPREVGNIIFDGEALCGIKVWNESDMNAQGKFWYDKEKHVLKLYSSQNPASYYSDVECALRADIINQWNTSYVIYDGLAMKYGGAHGIGGEKTHHIIVRNCDFSYIGGSELRNRAGVRYGNGVEFWGNAHDNIVEKCRFWEIYDAAVTNQNLGPIVKQYNIRYHNNLIWNCEYSFEYWNWPEQSQTHHIYFENNTCVNAGYGWGHGQRFDPSGRHLCFYGSAATAHDIYIRNNIFFEAKGNAFFAPKWPEATMAALHMDNNCWYQCAGLMILLKKRSYTMAQFSAYQSEEGKEANSIIANPQLVDVPNGDLHLTKRSPCIDAGTNLELKADYEGNVVPQGTAADIGAYEFPIDKKLSAIVNYERGMSRQPLIAVEELIRESQNRPEQRKYIELQLAELLSEATLDCKSFICQQLWFIGTADSVPAIAKLLTDEKTADMACYAMGQNPSPKAGEALRNALDKVGPKVQVRVINLLGDRGDVQSVEAMGKLVFAAERQVAEAAVAALGKIGGARASKILVEVRANPDLSGQLRFTATDAYLRCAEDLVFQGKSKQATVIYKELAGENEAALIRSAAVKGLADVGGPDAIPLVVTALRDEDRMVRTTAMGCVRTMAGEGVTELFAAELPKALPDEQVLLIGALADRGDGAALPAITATAKSANANVRKAALQAVGKLGNASHVGFLVQAATKGISSEEKRTAVNSLKLLRGSGVDDAIVKSMQNSQPNVRPQLIGVLFERNAVGAVSPLLKEASGSDSKVCRAAFKALGRLAGEKDLPSLIKLLVTLQDNSGRREAERAIVAVSRKISDDSKRADVVLGALRSENRVPVRCSLLRALGGIANSKALETLEAASKETDPAVRDTAVRALAKWPDATAAEALLEIYSNTQNQTHRLLALRGLVRLLALPAGDRRVQETLEMYYQVISGARGPEEEKLVLSGLANVSDPKALAMVQPFLQAEAVRAEAAMAAIKIAGAIIHTHRDQARMAMHRLLAVSQDEDLRKQAKEIIRQIKEFETKTQP